MVIISPEIHKQWTDRGLQNSCQIDRSAKVDVALYHQTKAFWPIRPLLKDAVGLSGSLIGEVFLKKQDHLRMNIAPHQTIILGLQIFSDHRSLISIGQKILMILPPLPHPPFFDLSISLEVFWMSFSLFIVFSSSYLSTFLSICLFVQANLSYLFLLIHLSSLKLWLKPLFLFLSFRLSSSSSFCHSAFLSAS